MPTLDATEFARLDRFERIAALGMASMHPGGLAATRQLIRWTGIGSGTRVLDLGCGVGQTSCLLAKRFGAAVTGLDKSARMVARARERAKSLAADVDFVEGDAYALPFPQETFEVVLAESVTLFLDRAKVLSECFRVLKPGGRVADVVMTCHEPVPAEVLDGLERLEGVRMHPMSPEEWLAAYHDAGFEVLRSEFVSGISDGASVWSFFRDNGLDGLRFLLRFLRLWLSNSAVRAYGRELTAFWRPNRHRFGFGLILARRP